MLALPADGGRCCPPSLSAEPRRDVCFTASCSAMTCQDTGVSHAISCGNAGLNDTQTMCCDTRSPEPYMLYSIDIYWQYLAFKKGMTRGGESSLRDATLQP